MTMSLLTLGNVYGWMMSVISPEMFMAEWCMLSPLTCFAFGKFEYFYLIQTEKTNTTVYVKKKILMKYLTYIINDNLFKK
jgi:hypothetical protein